MLRLNIGCQNNSSGSLPDWKTVDRENADYITDLSNCFNEWGEVSSLYGQADEILASHILGLLTREKGKWFLSNCYQLLKPGGVLHIATPDLDSFADSLLSAPVNTQSASTGHSWGNLEGFGSLSTKEFTEHTKQKYIYSQDSLIYRLSFTGFVNVQRSYFSNIHNPEYRAISLYMTAQKAM